MNNESLKDRDMRKFNGFSNGKPHVTRIPTQFFHELLPLIDDLAELKVTMYCMWAIQQKEGDYKYLRHDELVADSALHKGLKTIDADIDSVELLNDALQKAVTRGTLLSAEISLNDNKVCYYVMNSERGRLLIDQLQAGEWRPVDKDEIEILPPRPTIFALYEENIGVLTPMIVDSLKDAQQEFPVHWIEEAIKIAVEANVRRWKYILKVLEGWKQEGRSRETVQGHIEQHEQYTTGEWADFIES